MKMSRAPVTPETIEGAFECLGAVQCVTDAGIRLLRSADELAGERPRDWINGHRRAFGLRGPHEVQGELVLKAVEAGQLEREASDLVDYDDVLNGNHER